MVTHLVKVMVHEVVLCCTAHPVLDLLASGKCSLQTEQFYRRGVFDRIDITTVVVDLTL